MEPATQPAANPAPGGPGIQPPIVDSTTAAAGPSMVRVLGVAPTLPSDSQPAQAPHLYHLGAVAFFLDRKELSMSSEQRSKLLSLRDTAAADYATAQRKIDQAEQDLWALTSIGRPDAGSVEAKLTEIGRLSAQQRMSYIRAVGQAVAQLTDAQQMLLLAPTVNANGAKPTAPAAPTASASMSMGSATQPVPSEPVATPDTSMAPSDGMPMEPMDDPTGMGHM